MVDNLPVKDREDAELLFPGKQDWLFAIHKFTR
jgi:hypothetical protein